MTNKLLNTEYEKNHLTFQGLARHTSLHTDARRDSITQTIGGGGGGGYTGPEKNVKPEKTQLLN
jgi:hypothetical protein